MTYKVGVNIVDKSKVYTLWTLDGYTNNIRTFDTAGEAKTFGELVWPNQYVVDILTESSDK